MLGFLVIFTLLALTVLGIAVSLMTHWANGAEAASDRTPWRAREHALTREEFALLGVLGPAARLAGLDQNPLLLTRVPLTDILWLPKGSRRARFWERRIRGLRADIVICHGDDARPLLVVRFAHASSRETPRQRERDAAARQMLKGAGVPLLTLDRPVQIDPSALAQRIQAAIAEARGPVIVDAERSYYNQAAPQPLT